jgi:hypothetical protein
MKTLKIIILSLFILSGLSNCKKAEDSFAGSAPNNLTGNKWKVSLFQENGFDETSRFYGYEFQFLSNGNLTATIGSQTYIGYWYRSNVDDEVYLVIDFPQMTSFQEINDEWHMVVMNATTVHLEALRGGDATTKYLQFWKI